MALVCWSGGCDSTLVLHDVGVQRGGGSVRAVSIIHPQVNAAEQSEAARAELLRRLGRRKIKVQHTTVSLKHQGDFYATRGNGGLAQPLLWLSIAVSYLEPDEDLYLGYIRGDDLWHHREPFVRAFRMLQSVSGRTGKLLFPLEWVDKADVIKRLQALKLYSACWFCEEPRKGRKCDRCHPCVVHRVALWQLSQGLDNPAAFNEASGDPS